MMRKCFLTGEYIFFAEQRADRPHSFNRENIISQAEAELCPFCLGNEYMTPKKIFSTDDNSIRIVPNKYPFVHQLDPDHFGIHDVLIDTPLHDEKLFQFSDDRIFKLMSTIKIRINQLEEIEKIKYVQVFKNQGMEAGASQSHSHWQIAALSVVPPKYIEINKILKQYEINNRRCYFCNMDFGNRIIDENENFTAFTPYDSKFAYEVHIMPKYHISNFKYFKDNELKDFGILLRQCILRFSKLYDNFSYNICFYNSIKNDYTNHFYAQIIPRMGNMAGFEFSTGCYINSILPENAAKTLKDIKI